MEVMKQDNTPNVLSRETSITMGLIKPCFIVKKMVQKEISQEKIPKS